MFFVKASAALRSAVILAIFLTLFFSPQSTKAALDRICEEDNLVLGDIDAGTMKQVKGFTHRCLIYSQSPVTLQVISTGGLTGIGIAIHDFLVANDKSQNLTTETYGESSSAASLIFLAGKKRRVSCNSQILIHESTGVYSQKMGEKLLLENLTQTAAYNNSMANIYAKVTGLPKEKMREMMAKGVILGAAEAVRLGFATETIGDCAK